MSADRGGVMGEGWRGYRKKGRGTRFSLNTSRKNKELLTMFGLT